MGTLLWAGDVGKVSWKTFREVSLSLQDEWGPIWEAWGRGGIRKNTEVGTHTRHAAND